jgi:hypothetical protein
VLIAGVTPHTAMDSWTFAIEDEDDTTIASWGWEEFQILGPTEVTVAILKVLSQPPLSVQAFVRKNAATFTAPKKGVA